MALEEIRRERIAKIQDSGAPPAYPAETGRTHGIAEVLRRFNTLARGGKDVTVAGRMLARREHGGAVFIDLADGSGTVQAYLKRDLLGGAFDAFGTSADIGDFLEVTGPVMLTKREERTVEVRSWRMLAKSLRPLPEKWHGLKDVEERFRRRYLDLIMNEDVRQRFLLRSRLTAAVRSSLEAEGFLEVETPMLHPIPGGALARPFVTHHNALETDLYLRVAPELYLKRLLVGGFERVYELGRSFRNEGIDATHNPEFTMVEWYAAYWDEILMMDFVERLIGSVAGALKLKKTFTFDGNVISFERKFTRLTFKDVLKRHAQVTDYDNESAEDLAVRARQLGIESDPALTKGKIADEIFKKVCRPRLVDPTFVTNHPIDISPLAKRAPDGSEARRFQLVVGGLELANAFSELNDPLEQRRRFEEQARSRESGDEESHMVDEDYIEALEYGMPPAAGVGLSIDRLTMLFTDTKNIREVVLFPTLKPK